REPVTERRLGSVLFVDLVGFTPFAERRDAEDVREALDRYFTAAAETVERHGGLVEKFIGAAWMAVWGAPAPHEVDARRSLRAGGAGGAGGRPPGAGAGSRAGRGAAGACRRPHRGGGRQRRGRRPGHGHRRHRELGVTAAVGG